MKKIALTLLWIMAAALCAVAQERSVVLTIHVQTGLDDDLYGQPVTLEQTDYAVSYGSLSLDTGGRCSLKVYPGNHRLTVERPGYETATKVFAVADGESAASVSVSLVEKTRKPFALKADTHHDVMTGRNDIDLAWNVEAPVFTDDFESYSPFAVKFGDWTGIDADGEATAALQGSYPNRGIMQYAQIINPLTVVPTWWYEYPILRPYDGKQYAGFIRTDSGRANDDWLISPAMTPGTANVLEFMAKAADRYPERFMVYVTTKTDDPGVDDFIRLDQGNFESVDYRGWHKYSYDLSDYAGTPIKFAIRYISEANRNGAFMLMIDNVFVGQPADDTASRKAMRVKRSPANPYEKFNLYLDGVKVGTTPSYSYTFNDVAPGSHTLAVEATYRNAVSERSEISVDIPAGPYAKLTVNVEALSKLAADKVDIAILNTGDGSGFTATTDGGTVTMLSLPHGSYSAHVGEGVYNACSRDFDVTGDAVIDLQLTDRVIDPYNITADVNTGDRTVTLRWNRELGFKDSFETYEDFATGKFGDWTSVDLDQAPVYPIALGSATNIVSFPGSGDASNPTPIAPMVFNPWQTKPAMLPTDPAIAAPDGEKSVIFFSPQRTQADKWLISPVMQIREGYRLKFKAKAYSSMYPESLDVCMSLDASDDPKDFVIVGKIENLESSAWGEYSMDLGEYVGETVRLAIRYTSYDAFLAQVDEFEVGNPHGDVEFVDYGNVVAYDIYLDGDKVGESAVPEFVVNDVTEGEHTAGIVTRYLHQNSAMTQYTFGVKSGVGEIVVDTDNDAEAEIYDLAGRRLGGAAQPGIYIIRKGDKVSKRRL